MSRYELLERIGSGGMAEIFRGRAVAAGGFEKPVAIKRILPHLSKDEHFVKLLISEAKILASLRHRNIVQIYDVGQAEDGQFFLVMEFVDGVDLGAVQSELEEAGDRIALDVSLHIAAEVCEALDHAHRAVDGEGKSIRLVHRDISPSNILLSRSGEVKLTDFGIAKSIEEKTGHGAVRGKFAYISPEQSRNQRVDGRSDAYSLAIVLYELVTGRRLFSNMADFDALLAVREPRIASIRVADPRLPAALDDIIKKALAAKPEDRHASAAELGLALRSLRYSMDETSGDPAKSISGLVERVQRARELEDGRGIDDDRTMMRDPRHAALMAGPASFDEEETRAISILGDRTESITLSRSRAISQQFDDGDLDSADLPMSLPVPSPYAGGESEAHTILAASSPMGRVAVPPPAPHPSVSAASRSLAPIRPPQPGPATERVPSSPDAASFESDAQIPTLAGEARPATAWRSIIALGALAIVIALTAFVVAGKILAEGDAPPASGAAEVHDAGRSPDALDAGVDAAAEPADAAPAKRKRSSSKRKRRKKR